MLVLALFVSLTALPDVTRQGAAEVVAEIFIQGNVATPDQEVIDLTGIKVGSPFGPTTLTDVAARLRAAKRFESIEVLKRFASIDDPTRIALVVIVDEGTVKIEKTGDPASPIKVVRTRGPHLMFLPVLTGEDGYGVTYGARFTLPDPAGKGSRVSFPATWGGEKRAAIEFDKELVHGPLTRVTAEAAISRRTHPFFEQDDDRRRVGAGVEREITRSLRVGASAGWQHVSFLGSKDSFVHAGGDVVLDTRLDPMLARNAVYGRAAWTHFDFKTSDALNQSELEGRGYVGLLGQSVLVVRALRDDADKPRPAYLQPILGSLANLRGFKAGTSVGDTLVAGSVELRLPLVSPLSVGKIGVNAFVDTATIYNKGERLADQTWKRGVGGGVWLSATFVRLNIAVAHGIGATTRVHFGGTFSF